MSPADDTRRSPFRDPAGERHAVLLPLVLLLAICTPFMGTGQEISDRAVRRRIAQLQGRVLRLQNMRDGSWKYQRYPVGATALAVLALRVSGVRPEDAAVQAGLQYILTHTDGLVYSEGLVPCALEHLDPARHRNRIRQAVTRLARAQGNQGGWSYSTALKNMGLADTSNTQFAVLGLAAAERCGVPIPDETRKRAVRYFTDSQEADGSWGYNPHDGSGRLSMTCAGIASLHLLGVPLEHPGDTCGAYRYNPIMVQGLRRVTDQLRNNPDKALGSRWPYYTLYALERVGILLEVKAFGGVDWYRYGTNWLLRRGTMGSLPDACFELLFLAKGATPVAIAKWRWQGDWNNDHRDVREWVDITGEAVGQKLDWITARLDSMASPAAGASMIFVNGHETLRAGRSELSLLRAYLEAGGTLVAEGCCGSRPFLESFGSLVLDRLYPDRKLKVVPLTETHPVCTAHHTLTPDEVGAFTFKAGCRKTRILLLHKDISCALNGEDVPDKELERARRVATNILVWSLRSRRAGGKLANIRLSPASNDADALTADQIERQSARSGPEFQQPLGRARHRGDWTADIHLFPHLRDFLALHPGLPTFDGEIYVSLTGEDLFHSAVLFMNGHDAPQLRDAEIINLRTYLQNGGFLLASACCSSEGFRKGFREMLAAVLPNDALEEIPGDDPIRTTPFDLTTRPPAMTPAARDALDGEWGPLHGIRRQGRWIVVYTDIDTCCAIDGDLEADIIGYAEPSAHQLVANILAYALTP